MSDLPKPTRRQAITLLKWVWMLIVLLGFAAYIIQNFDNITAQFSQLSISSLCLAIIVLSIGRLGIVLLTKSVLFSIGFPIRFQTVFYMVATSDLAKYLPGGIWHFVGRASYYKAANLPLISVTQAMLKENLWLILSAGLSSVLFLIVSIRGQSSWWIVLLISLIWCLIIYLWEHRKAQLGIIAIVGLQFLIWGLIGLSFFILLPISFSISTITLVIGAFAMSWLIGFVSLFAPGGIGIREAVLVALLLPLLSTSESASFVIIHRLLWISVELLFGLLAWLFFDLDS